MKKRICFYLFFLNGFALFSQNAISGQILMENGEFIPKVHLTKLGIDQIDDFELAKSVAIATMQNDGSFTFDKKYISNRDALYHIYVNRVEEAMKDTMPNGTTFILSKSDQIHFFEAPKPFSKYTTTNLADKEWKKLQAFEKELLQSQLALETEEDQLKKYSKDSLRILMVKLIGVKQLEKKGLLEQDIAKNSDFYLALLTELQESKIPVENYLFLEKRLAFLTQDKLKEKYAWSKTANYLLILLVLSLTGILVATRKKKQIIAPLSRQELNIQNLIIEGKTNKEIANELFISLSTVKTHITNIYAKLNVSSRNELLRNTQN